MDDYHQTPAFRSPPQIVAHGPTPASTCYSPPEPPKISPETLEAISQLGLRYQPSAQADLQAHGARVALLANDLADLEPHRLRAAIARWVSFKPFLPKASELRTIADSLDAQVLGSGELEQWCEDQNAWAKRLGADWWYHVVNRAMEDGSTRRQVEKLEGWRALQERAKAEGRKVEAWKPKPGEVEAIQRNVAECFANGMSQYEFNRMIDRAAHG